jgi:hypothetical protein
MYDTLADAARHVDETDRVLSASAADSLKKLQAASATLLTYEELQRIYMDVQGKILAQPRKSYGDPAREADEKLLAQLVISMVKASNGTRTPRELQEDLSAITKTRGGRRRTRRTRHSKTTRRVKRRGGRLPVFKGIEQKGDRVNALVQTIVEFVDKGDGESALPHFRELRTLVGPSEARRMLVGLPPKALAKILQA